MDAVHADKREIFATTKEDLEHGIAGHKVEHRLHFQTGVLFETLQAFSLSGLRAIAAVLVSRRLPAHRRSDRGHRLVERKDELHATLYRLHDVAR